ncbi:hypothetical protein B0A48_05025 [Cryoendolithus antarcticus]|uniref:SGNH hydrolase-type esterase domain-containing protein n=1 Tax=Cryoendolithus antarcticus TaxID=1507870 RepID=A0A1V8TE25_9PEZI|nr:hypothetical protein B0A48_05025 [Cryoendolithus antarcticus]
MYSSSLALWSTFACVCFGLPSGTTPWTRTLRRDASDPSDLSWIKDWASVGDSFSTGVGAGKRMEGCGDPLCSRYDAGFPSIINADDNLAGDHTFTNLACTGATVDVVNGQVTALKDGSQDFVTITAGINDAFFADILDHCVFGWTADHGMGNSPCSDQLSKSQSVVDSADFHSKLDTLISSAKAKLKSDGHIYYIGYAQVFGQDSNQCDSVTWSMPYNYGNSQYLTQDRRAKLNALTKSTNKALSDAASRAGASVTFVDYDKYVPLVQGRFCEDKHPETNGNRAGLLFYEWYTDDNVLPTRDDVAKAFSPPLLMTETLALNDTFDAAIGDYVLRAIAANATLGQSLTIAKPPIPNLLQVNATLDQIAHGYAVRPIPDGFNKIFHPRPNAHQLVADLVVYNIQANYARKLGQEPGPEVVDGDTCPAPPPLAPTPAPQSDPDATEICGTWYKVLFDHFEIYGAHFDEAEFSSDGEKLKHELEGCGEVTKWSFKTLTNDPNGFQWFASGNLPIGTKACVGRAVVSAGLEDEERW